ncbi:MAG: hypothetical protein ACRC1F_00505 [Metamycoplasmataceae bacterium]
MSLKNNEKNNLSEKMMVQNFKKMMKSELDFFKSQEQIKILPNIIDFAYYDYSKNSLIGIEFKKYDWKKVICQASLISKKFNETYICLIKPMRKSTCNKIIAICESLNIGVIFYCQATKNFEWFFNPEANKTITQIFFKKNLTLEQYFKKANNTNVK